MQQLTFLTAGHLEWREVPVPSLQHPAQAIVRPIAVATCDLDAALIRGQTPFTGPFAFGHEFIAEVIQVGEAVQQITAGQLVIVPFQISCGTCARCQRGQTGDCLAVQALSMYGLAPVAKEWGGALRSTEPGGVCTSTGIYFRGDIALPLFAMYTTGVTFKTGRIHARPTIPKILDLVRTGRLHPEQITSEVASWEEAIDALLSYQIKLIITRERSAQLRADHPIADIRDGEQRNEESWRST